MVSHYVPVGSHPRAGGWDRGRGRGAAADGVLGQYLFFNLAGVFTFVVFQELHSMCIGRFSISVWSDHLMVGLRPALMGLSAGWFPIMSPWVPMLVPGVGAVVPRPMAFKGNTCFSIWRVYLPP
jgi:hypothetical protein